MAVECVQSRKKRMGNNKVWYAGLVFWGTSTDAALPINSIHLIILFTTIPLNGSGASSRDFRFLNSVIKLSIPEVNKKENH